MRARRAVAYTSRNALAPALEAALRHAGILDSLSPTSRIALKPNLTYPFHKPGITTSPEMIRETVRLLREFTRHIAIVESDGGYGVWSAESSFQGHGLTDLRNEFDVELVNLSREPHDPLTFLHAHKLFQVPLPSRLLHQTDLLISLPVPKIHCMTGLTMSYKNQWGCIGDTMRLRSHHLFDDAIVAINRALKPAVLADGRYFLDRNGPMEGNPVRMDLIIAATDAGAFDLYVSELMGFSWRRVSHLRRAVTLGDMPGDLSDIQFNVHPDQLRTHTFRLNRSLRNWIALSGFRSRFLTWLGYESWFGKNILHNILYAIAGKPTPLQPEYRNGSASAALLKPK